MPDSLANRTLLKIRYYRAGARWYGFALGMLIDVMSKLGLRLEPYRVYLEGLGNTRAPTPPTGLDGSDLGFLGAIDMAEIARMPGRSLSEDDLRARVEAGMLCLGVKYRGSIVAFTWCNLHLCTFEKHPLFSLETHEASLFDAYTVESFRGRDLAPWMRYRCYEEMASLGRDRCYSVTVVFNAPAVRFKQKLGAQALELGVFVEILRRWRFHTRLKRYTSTSPVPAQGATPRLPPPRS